MSQEQINFGPAGIGGFKEAEKNFEYFNKMGIKCAEIPFTYQIWLTNQQAEIMGEIAKKFNIELSIHAPYYINLNSQNKEKIKASMKRILLCCERAHYLNAKNVVFHAAYYGTKIASEVYQIVKEKILEMKQKILENSWQVNLAPETTGKLNQFGSLQELLQLRKDTGCFLCIDFAHLEAREGKKNYDGWLTMIKDSGIKKLHCHFSGIEYGEKGEIKHIVTPSNNIKEMLLTLSKFNLQANIINESPSPIEDSLRSLKIWKMLKNTKKI